ncbi:SDR family NAD(P)-dependent oxidoreductase [Castellaniella sp. S9]|uniref:SDR family NAD(P)-dependent oxidoreductase n=1 Tax=Castellaniella sp. S9 TaxID=2993652 RepID=UPI0022B5DD2F|nr:SDR family NAD(P)-dependent oxidoreductase [Castellaniella sp. S9]
MNRLDGKVAVITGASTPHGIGYATAEALAREGASLLLVADGTEEQLQSAADACRALGGGGRVEAAAFDLGQSGSPESMIAKASELFGRIDVLVNNAVMRAPAQFGEFSRETFEHVIGVNIAAAFFASQAVVPLMKKQGGGRIIHVASQLGHVASPRQTLYGLTKAALIHLTKSMASELCTHNIIVNSVSPGPIATQPILDRLLPVTEAAGDGSIPGFHGNVDTSTPWNSDKVDMLPIARLGDAQEVADVIRYLSVESPGFLMGQDIVVDGGYLLR